MVPKAVVLLSGGLDSTTVLALAARDGFELYALSFRYGQRHASELAAAAQAAARYRVTRHLVQDIDLRSIGGSALTADMAIPKDRDLSLPESSVPVTYVPARNTIFLSFAIAWAEVLGARDIFIGVNALDYSGYPDCRPEFIAAVEEVARLGTRAGVEGGADTRTRIRTPLIALTKADIIALGQELGVDYSATSSCYDPAPDGGACGHCDACQLRARGFADAGVRDPTRYAPDGASRR